MVLDVTAKERKSGKVLWQQKKEYFEIGLDWDGDRRYGAWQIKDIVDYTLPPRTTTTEKFYLVFEPETKAVDLEVKLRYVHKPGVEFLVHHYKETIEWIR